MLTSDLSVVIVSYNTRQLLLNCLASIQVSTRAFPIECIVVDNVSKDGSAVAVREQFPQVKLIENVENNYFSAANNQGLAAACGRYVLILNPDTLVKGETLRQLVAQMDADPDIGAATTNLYFPDGTLQRNGSCAVTFGYLLLNYTFIGKLLTKRKQRLNDQLWYADWDRKSAREIDVLPGSCIIASRETWQAVGGLDPRLPMYFSDDYFSRAVRTLGKRTMYLLTDGIIHYENASTKQTSRRALNLYLHDLLIYTRLVFGRVAQLTLTLLLIPTWLVQTMKARN